MAWNDPKSPRAPNPNLVGGGDMAEAATVTLRDLFAAAFIAGLAANQPTDPDECHNMEDMVEWSFMAADMMLGKRLE